MGQNRARSTAVAALLSAALIGGGGTAIAPAVADDSASYVATKWKQIWKKKLVKHADARYYTKAQSDSEYSTETETGAALGNYYTKAQSDAGYAVKGSSYTKAESDAGYAIKGSSYSKAEADAKYLPQQGLIRGTYDSIGSAGAAGDWVGDNVSFGVTLSAPPTVHYIAVGQAIPVGCSGSAAAPNAAAGHLCLFEAQNINVASRFIFDGTGGDSLASTFGASTYVSSAAAGDVFVYGTWAVRPVALAASVAAKGGGVNVRTPGESRVGD